MVLGKNVQLPSLHECSDIWPWCSNAAGGFFLVALLPEKGTDKLVGFTCGTLTQSDSLTHESMARHEADGTLLCLHSVCIDRAYQRRGFAMRMLQAYLIFIQQTSPQVNAYTGAYNSPSLNLQRLQYIAITSMLTSCKESAAKSCMLARRELVIWFASLLYTGHNCSADQQSILGQSLPKSWFFHRWKVQHSAWTGSMDWDDAYNGVELTASGHTWIWASLALLKWDLWLHHHI